MNQQLSKTLSSLHRGQQVTVIYDGKFEKQRLQVTGTVERIDQYWKTLQVNKIGIDFSEIHDIQI